MGTTDSFCLQGEDIREYVRDIPKESLIHNYVNMNLRGLHNAGVIMPAANPTEAQPQPVRHKSLCTDQSLLVSNFAADWIQYHVLKE